ncbi:hypothetical protein [Streptomyces sp. NPDC059928]|uniref:hypothetical protein n=1 Tax=unclassified Streptomyces TaxID=2593676 RepID=UPI00365C5A6D
MVELLMHTAEMYATPRIPQEIEPGMTRIPLKPLMTSALLALAATGVLALSGCTAHLKDRGPIQAAPTNTPTGTPAAAETALAERYHRSGGAQDVYGIQYRSDSGATVIDVWTRNPDDSSPTFDNLRNGVTSFLAREEHVSLAKGYQLYVVGPTGALQHRWDTTP